MKYNYLVVGSGLYGAVFAHEAHGVADVSITIWEDNNVGEQMPTKRTVKTQSLCITT